MADSTAVAIVGVTAGAVVAVCGPVIVSRSTTAGQLRKFEYDEWMDERRALRRVLDDVLVKIDEFEAAIRSCHRVYVESGEAEVARSGVLARGEEVSRRLELGHSRIALQLGSGARTPEACRSIMDHGSAVLNSINRYLVLGEAAPMPGHRHLESEVKGMEDATDEFRDAAKAALAKGWNGE